jgi:hypothetical protein
LDAASKATACQSSHDFKRNSRWTMRVSANWCRRRLRQLDARLTRVLSPRSSFMRRTVLDQRPQSSNASKRTCVSHAPAFGASSRDSLNVRKLASPWLDSGTVKKNVRHTELRWSTSVTFQKNRLLKEQLPGRCDKVSCVTLRFKVMRGELICSVAWCMSVADNLKPKLSWLQE